MNLPAQSVSADTREQSAERVIEVTAADLPLHCPTPAMMLWNSHPRVFLDVARTGEALCPYCGTRFLLKGGATAARH